MRHILYATDGSEGALAAGRFLATLPCDTDRQVDILTVCDIEGADDGTDILLAAVKAVIGSGTHLSVTTATASARSKRDVVTLIVDWAARSGADLIIVGSRGMSCAPDRFMGSIAEGVARSAACPVLIAPSPRARISVTKSEECRDQEYDRFPEGAVMHEGIRRSEDARARVRGR